MLCFVHFCFHGLQRRWFLHMFWFDAWTETAPCRFGRQHSLPWWPTCAAIPCHLSCSEKLGLICKCTELLEAKHSWPLAVQQSWDVLSGIANSMTEQYYWDTVLKDKTNRQQTFALFIAPSVYFMGLIIYIWVIFNYCKAQWGCMFLSAFVVSYSISKGTLKTVLASI